MGHQINPIFYRLGITTGHSANWFAKKNFALYLHEDNQIRAYLEKSCS